jgi:hypothetical protein
MPSALVTPGEASSAVSRGSAVALDRSPSPPPGALGSNPFEDEHDAAPEQPPSYSALPQTPVPPSVAPTGPEQPPIEAVKAVEGGKRRSRPVRL